MSQCFQLRCHRCNRWLGETRAAMELVGLFAQPRDREWLSGPRDTWQCKACGWVNVFKPIAAVAGVREMELKRGTG